jgi:hypothetical protein
MRQKSLSWSYEGSMKKRRSWLLERGTEGNASCSLPDLYRFLEYPTDIVFLVVLWRLRYTLSLRESSHRAIWARHDLLHLDLSS